MYTDINRCAGEVLHGFQTHDVIKWACVRKVSTSSPCLSSSSQILSPRSAGSKAIVSLLPSMQIIKISLHHPDHKTIDLDDCLILPYLLSSKMNICYENICCSRVQELKPLVLFDSLHISDASRRDVISWSSSRLLPQPQGQRRNSLPVGHGTDSQDTDIFSEKTLVRSLRRPLLSLAKILISAKESVFLVLDSRHLPSSPPQ